MEYEKNPDKKHITWTYVIAYLVTFKNKYSQKKAVCLNDKCDLQVWEKRTIYS